MADLSVVLAVHNEETNLGTCLEAIKEFTDELIVVDGESTDGTVAIAKHYHANIISTTNKANFHINKQMAMDAASKTLVLQLDADEVVDSALTAFIQSLKSHSEAELLADDAPKAWYLRRKNHLFNHWLSKGGQYPDPVIRLYLRGYAKLPQQNVHEQMTVSGAVATADGHLLHFAYPHFSDYVRKFNTYTSFEAKRLYDELEGKQLSIASYFFLKPITTLFSLYGRHRGYVDGFAGFVFALMSSLHHPFVWLKYQELTNETID